MSLNMGPSHPATHGTVKFLIELDGETHRRPRRRGRLPAPRLREGVRERRVVPGDPLHRPPELQLGRSSATSASAWRCEKLCAVETPERCQWLRVLAGELSRIGDHLTRTGAACLELQAMTPVPLRDRGARAELGPPGGALRRAGHLQLRAHRRREARPAAPASARASATPSPRPARCSPTSTTW